MLKKVIVLVSGGMDSVAALYEADNAHSVVRDLALIMGRGIITKKSPSLLCIVGN